MHGKALNDMEAALDAPAPLLGEHARWKLSHLCGVFSIDTLNQPMRKTDAARVIWMVDDDESFRDLSSAVAGDARIKVVNMSADDLIERRGDALPDGRCSMARSSLVPKLTRC